MPQPVTAPAQASVSVDRIAQTFNFEWATSEPVDGLDTYWWWVRDIRLDPDEVIADDGEGGTWRVPFTTDGDFNVTFATPVQVRETYVDVAAPAAAASAATARVNQQIAARGLERPTKPDPSNPAASRPEPQEGAMPAITPEQFRALRGLPEDATEEQIQQALTADPAPQPGNPQSPGPVEGDPVTDPATPLNPANPEAPASPATPSEPQEPATVPDPIAATQAEALQNTSQRLAQLEAEAAQRVERETRQRRDAHASQWVQEGRIAPSEREHYRELLDIDEQRTLALASNLAAGRIPLTERGSDDPAAAAGHTGAATTTGWFAQLAHKES